MKFPEHTKAKTRQRKQIYVIITAITLLMIMIVGLFCGRLVKNGLTLRGMLMTSIGQQEEDIQNLEPLYCLVMGISEDISTELTDTIMLCAYFPQDQKVSILSIPRDTFIGDDKDNTTSYDKINALYQKSPENTLEAVRKLTGVDVRNYVVINNNALEKVIDAVGGIYFDVPIDMWYDDPTQDLHIYINKGYQLLNGENAVKVLRFRHNNDMSTYPKEYGEQDRILLELDKHDNNSNPMTILFPKEVSLEYLTGLLKDSILKFERSDRFLNKYNFKYTDYYIHNLFQYRLEQNVDYIVRKVLRDYKENG